MILTVEETTLTGSFDHSSRAVAIAEMTGQLGLICDPGLREQIRRTVKKLRAMTDDEFTRLDFTVYEEDDDEQMG